MMTASPHSFLSVKYFTNTKLKEDSCFSLDNTASTWLYNVKVYYVVIVSLYPAAIKTQIN